MDSQRGAGLLLKATTSTYAQSASRVEEKEEVSQLQTVTHWNAS